MLRDEISKMDLPPLLTRDRMADVLQRCIYGYLPKISHTVFASDPKIVERRYACGTVEHSYVDLTVNTERGSHTFRVDRLLHKDGRKRPLVVYISFHRMSESPYFPIEEMSEYDADFLSFCYKDVTSDNVDMTDGIAPLLSGSTSPCGKIAMWAWAASRVIDHGLTLDGTDADNIAVAGHSRLGKTALFCAMTDDRIKFVLSNASGCLGASLAHGAASIGRKETYRDIHKNFPYWFSPAFADYADSVCSDEFDAHYLLASLAPRFVLVGSCSLDAWADPRSEQLCCAAASPVWEDVGYDGFLCDSTAKAGEAFTDGRIGYFMIESMHFMSRHSWRHYLNFIAEKSRTNTAVTNGFLA